MLEINPVLAGTFDQPDYTPAATNISSKSTEDANGVDARRYTQFDRTAANSGTTDMSFGDLLDMLNPFEHIPIISSAFRELTGDKINPVARVAGDIIYGGLAGGASALAGGVGAIAEEVFQQMTGKPVMTYAADALFGSGATASTQVADAVAMTPPPPVAAASPTTIPAITTAAATLPAAASAAMPAVPDMIPLASAAQSVAQNTSPLTAAKAYPITPNKLPYGGVMDPGPNNSNIARAQDMAIALSEASPTGLRLGHTVYTNGLMAGLHQTPQTRFPSALAALGAAPTSTGGNTANVNPTPQSNGQLPQALLDDISALKALNQYKSTASAPAATGSTLDITN
jgi:hypothetical protein